MRVSEMIAELTKLQTRLGDVEVLITDGWNAHCYRGDYGILPWHDGENMTIDIGIGGCLELGDE